VIQNTSIRIFLLLLYSQIQLNNPEALTKKIRSSSTFLPVISKLVNVAVLEVVIASFVFRSGSQLASLHSALRKPRFSEQLIFTINQSEYNAVMYMAHSKRVLSLVFLMFERLP